MASRNTPDRSPDSEFETPTRGARLDFGNTATRRSQSPGDDDSASQHRRATPSAEASQGSMHEAQNSMQDRWAHLSSAMRGHSQAAAELLMKQAATTSQVEEMVKHLLFQVQQREQDKRRLEAQILQDRADFTAQAKLLSQHFTSAHHRTTALQVAHEAQQGEIRHVREQLDVAAQENNVLKQQLVAMRNELVREHNQRTQGDVALQEHGAAIEEMQQELQQSRACCEELHTAKAHLHAQVKAMVRAEKELTESLKHTHQQIEEQLKLLKEQLQQERQRRAAAVRRKGELVQHVNVLATQLESYKEAFKQQQQQQLQQSPHQGNDQAAGSRADRAQGHGQRQVPRLQPGLRSLGSRRPKGIKLALPSHSEQGKAGYTAAFAPPTSVKAGAGSTPEGRPQRAATPSSHSQQTTPAASSGAAAASQSLSSSSGPIKLRSIRVVLQQTPGSEAGASSVAASQRNEYSGPDDGGSEGMMTAVPSS